MMETDKETLGITGAWLGVGGNLLLTVIKLAAGIGGKSQGLIAEAVHSLVDLFSSIGVLIGLKISSRPADSRHPFGHGKAESIVAGIVSAVLILTGVQLAYTGIRGVITGSESVPSLLTLYVALFTVVYNEALFRYRLFIGQRINSPAIISDAWHQRADAFACAAVSLGIIGARFGCPVLDPAAAAVVSLFIIKAGWNLVKESLDQLMDASAGQETDETINAILQSIPEIREVESIRTRSSGGGIICDLKFRVNPALTVEEAHHVSVDAKNEIISRIPAVRDVSIHYGPSRQEGDTEI
ncbi:MAG: cation diffusion facilitator family transporter [Peptococcaceae bacterium]|jgi:cation diffusion facilitator family transporter|nr:cation diffusion facilitator family transporter [Peptococcaceae bacterium]MDH7523995.1 cation diffusion facilitator family transporter [Peptococcaceae bacterium]